MFNIKEVDAGDVQHKLTIGSGVRLIDVRSPAEVAQGAIPGAVHIPLQLLPMHMNEFSDDVDTVIYCHSGIRSAQACAFLQAQGIQNVFNLRGGIIAWVQSGFALT